MSPFRSVKRKLSSIAPSIGICGFLLCVAGLPAVRASDDRVTGSGTYHTSFEIPVPPSPAAPKVLLTYDSGTNGSLAGIGWDVSVGWPTSIVRDIRLGTMEWKFDTPWLWGSTPLVPKTPATGPNSEPFDCATSVERQFRTAPDTLACIAIDLTPTREAARVRLATGITLRYRPIIYDGTTNPAPPAGNETTVLAFRLESVTDSNGFRSCYSYQDFNDTKFGKIGVLHEIAYGPTPLAGDCSNSAFRAIHRIVFDYLDLEQAGYFATWTVRFGAPVKFGSLLRTITVFAAGRRQDEFTLIHEGTAETHQPRLVRIERTVEDALGQPKRRVERSYLYGERTAGFDGGQVVELPDSLRDLRSFPDSIAGSVTRPMLRPQLLDNPLGAGQIGQDVATNYAPVTTVTTEQWAMTDINGDGLPDFQWSKEKGTDPAAPEWSTFGIGIDRTPQFADRPAQQAVIVNEGIAGDRLAATTQFINSHAPSLETRYAPGTQDPDGGSPWFWLDGNGMTRTGMPVSVSAGEISNPAPNCPFESGQDSRLWPRYPDGRDTRTSGSMGTVLAPSNLIPAGANIDFIGNPVLSIIQGINQGYRPNYGISSTLSGWLDLDGDGVKDFVATPSGIERFTLEPTCTTPSASANASQPWRRNARLTLPAATGSTAQGHTTDTDWRRAPLNSSNGTGTSCSPGQLCLDPLPGPRGVLGLPLSYETSTSAPVTIGLTVPVSGVVKAVVSAIATQSWLPLATAGPGHTVDILTPRSATGYALSVRTPSTSGLMQAMGNIIYSAASSSSATSGSESSGSAGSIASLILSLIPVDFDLTLLSAKNTARSETQVRLVDVNADGLADLVLHNNGSPAIRNDFLSRLAGPKTAISDPMAGVTDGDLVVFFNSANGFGATNIINRGMNHSIGVPNLAAMEGAVADARLLIAPLNNSVVPGPDKVCYSGIVPAIPAIAQPCGPFAVLLASLIDKADSVTGAIGPLLASTKDATPRELSLKGEVDALNAVLKGARDFLERSFVAAGVGLPSDPVVTAAFVPMVDTVTAAGIALVEDLGYMVRTAREIGHASRVNVVNQAFSSLDGSFIDQTAAGISVNTRGFVDLNGDGLPDYVVTNHRTNDPQSCSADQWEVFWGSGTSSISAQRAFLPTPSCISVATVPSDVAAFGYTTLPLSVDRVQRAAHTAGESRIDTVVHSHVSLVDYNQDGRPDLLIAGIDPWDANANTRTWSIFLNTGNGFELTPSLTVSSPTPSVGAGIEPASPEASRALGFGGIEVPYPVMGTTRAVSNPGSTRSSSATHTAFVDIDGNGVEDIVRRIRRVLDDGTKREALYVWRRRETGPHDLMIEERFPLEGQRTLIEYRPSSAFQWTDGEPNGRPPQLGHQPVSGIRGQLVRSLTTEPLLGRSERRTRRGYDYKQPFFDMKTRTFAGFALRRSVPLDPDTGTPIDESLDETSRSAQRPDLVPGITSTRFTERGSGAPVRESFVSYSETTTATNGIGGLNAVFTAPTRRFEVEYPSGLKRGAVFDVGFDGRQPFRDRVTGNHPLGSPPLPALDPTAATGGAARWPANAAPGLAYASPHAAPGSAPPPLAEATVETWLRPVSLGGEHTIIDAGAYRLFIARDTNGYRFRFDVTGAPSAIATAPVTSDRWYHVVASFGQGAVRMFVNGVSEASVTAAAAPFPSANMLIGCASNTGGTQDRCFTGDIGELRLYPEAWTSPTRVTDTETEIQSTNTSGFDFGQPIRVLARNDLATPEDDLATEYQYAAAGGASPIFGLVSSEAKRALLAGGATSGDFLAYSEKNYDGLPLGQSTAGNATRVAQYDGQAPVAVRPTSLRVATRFEYLDSLCPGRITKTTDPAGFSAQSTFDPTCTFILQTENALGHTSGTRYYGVHNPATPIRQVTGAHGTFVFNGRYGQVAQTIDANRAQTLSTYDEWGRTLAVWSPLDRRDRPGVRFEYADAICKEPSTLQAPCERPTALALHAPARTTVSTWDDQLRRCKDFAGAYVSCSSPSASKVAEEPGTGAYAITHSFADGQTHAQIINNNGNPDWTVVGTADFDRLGRKVREYKVRYLPRQRSTTIDPCPPAGEWCDSTRLNGDPLRKDVASVQLAYDAQNRLTRIYGPGIPRCPGDPSGLTPNGDMACDGVVPTTPPGDVTKFRYPSPGETRTEDANGVPSVIRKDTRGLVNKYDEFLKTSALPYSTVRTAYDHLGRVDSVTDQAANVSRNSYDALSRTLTNDDPDLGRSTYAYDLRSLPTERIVASGEKTINKYDELGRVTQTDYLRPHAVPSPPICCNVPGGNVPVGVFPESCTVAPGLTPPVGFAPALLGPRPLLPPTALKLVRGGLNGGEAQIRLPFDLRLASLPLSESRGGRTVPRGATGALTFGKGTLLAVSTNGRVTFRGALVAGQPVVEMTLDVFSANLALVPGGLRVITSDLKGAQSLALEWEGRLATRQDARVVIRAILSEAAPSISYEYERVPADSGAEIGIHLKRGTVGFDLSATKPAQNTRSFNIGDGSVLAFGDRNFPGVRLSCDRGGGRIEIPIKPRQLTSDSLRLRYRAFSDCNRPQSNCGSDDLRLQYRLPGSNDVRELARATVNARPLSQQGNIADQTPDNFIVPIPVDLRGQPLDLFIAHNGSKSGGAFVLDVTAVEPTTIVYEPEERVYRTYDSSEPRYFHQAKAGGGGLQEARPVLDLSFDVDGRAEDRSPTTAPFTCIGSVGTDIGASGRALKLSPNASCQASTLPASLTAATLEFWLRPEERQQPQTLSTLGSMLADFSVGVLEDGRLWCGPPAARVTSRVAVPTDAWSHLAMVFDGSSVKCLVNGDLQGVAALPRRNPMFPFTVGSTLLLSGGTAGAAVDEVRLIGTARSDAEILEDALRPLAPGPPRGNLLHLAFGAPSNYGTDTSKAGNNATLSGGSIVPGILGMSLDTQTGGRVTVPHSATLELADVLTAEVWMKMRGTRATPSRLIGKWQGNAGPGWRLGVQANSGRLLWEVVTEFTPPLGTSQVRHAVFVTYEQISDNNWHHVAGTYDGRRLRVFIDGIPAHRWCSPIETPGTGSVCLDPPDPTPCTVEARTWELPAGVKALGDAVCVQGSVNNTVPVLIASDAEGADFDGWIDEARLSNYTKREFEVAASARLASAFTQSIGREVTVRNQLPVGEDLAWQVAREHRAFDLEGNAVSWLKRVRGQKSTGDFVARAAPDSLARVGTLEYPHAEVVANGFSLGGVQDLVVGYGPDAGSGPGQSKTYVRNATATVTGKLASTQYGNGVSSAWTYDDALTAAGGFGPETLKTSRINGPPPSAAVGTPVSPGPVLSDRVYLWDAVRDLTSVTDTAPNTTYTAAYIHDDLRRVSQASFNISGTASSHRYGYDPLGNLQTKEGATQDFGRATFAPSCPAIPTAIPHALTRRTVGVAADSYCYDASGRLVKSPDTPNNNIRNYQYYARGKVSHLSDRNGESAYSYDGDGLRVWKVEPGGSQTVPFGFYRELPAGREAAYSMAGRMIARRSLSPAAEIIWFSTDHLDGTNFLTDEGGAEVPSTRAFYRPFGEFVSAKPQTEKSGSRQFTSKELDTSGLYDFNARMYDPATGGFTQADEINVGPSPQAQNRLSYVFNNPLRMVDPSGHAPIGLHDSGRLPAADVGELSSQVEWINDPEGGVVAVPKEFGASIPIDPNRWAGALTSGQPGTRIAPVKLGGEFPEPPGGWYRYLSYKSIWPEASLQGYRAYLDANGTASPTFSPFDLTGAGRAVSLLGRMAENSAATFAPALNAAEASWIAANVRTLQIVGSLPWVRVGIAVVPGAIRILGGDARMGGSNQALIQNLETLGFTKNEILAFQLLQLGRVFVTNPAVMGALGGG